MTFTLHEYRHSEAAFRELLDLCAASYAAFDKPRNWLLDRWNFTASASRVMNGLSISDWERNIGLWRDGAGTLIAIAHEEENKGNVFFEFRSPAFQTPELMEELFKWAESALARQWPGRPIKGFGLRIDENDGELSDMARARGYRIPDYREPLSLRDLALAAPPPYGSPDAVPPAGFTLATGNALLPELKARAHMRAFGYEGDPRRPVEKIAAAFEALRETPDSTADLDLALLDSEGEIASFVGVWAESPKTAQRACAAHNAGSAARKAGSATHGRYGVLEPVGTIPSYRRLGLAQWLIEEGARRLLQRSISTLYVGSDQDFYLASGFKVITSSPCWDYEIKGAN